MSAAAVKKTSNKKPRLTASLLRIVLTASLFLIVLIMVGIFIAAQHVLRSEAVSVSSMAAQADASASMVQSLGATKLQLQNNQSAVQRASEIVAESKQYQYQNQIINDLTTFAKNNNVSITDITFPTSTTPATGAAPAAPAVPGAAGGASPASVVSGVKSVTASITLKNPVGYTDLLNFVNAIQSNLTKMQVSSLSLTSGDGGISSDVLTIQVYVR